MKTGSAWVTFQVCYKFGGWNKETSKRKKTLMREYRAKNRERQKQFLITLMVDTLGNLVTLLNWQLYMLPTRESGMLINCSCDP